MNQLQRGRRVAAWSVLAVSASVAAAVAATGFLLAERYRPSAPSADPHPYPDVHRLVELNDAVIGLLSGLALLLVGASLEPRTRRAFQLSWWSAGASVVALVATLATGVTREQVQFEQVGLWAVTVGRDLRGYRVATGHDVRFALIDGVEVAPSTYEAVLAVHLAAPVVVLLALAVIGWDLARRRPVPELRRTRVRQQEPPRASGPSGTH